MYTVIRHKDNYMDSFKKSFPSFSGFNKTITLRECKDKTKMHFILVEIDWEMLLIPHSLVMSQKIFNLYFKINPDALFTHEN